MANDWTEGNAAMQAEELRRARAPKPAPVAPVYRQGAVIVEPDPIDGGVLVMLPTGDILRADDADGAEAIARGYFSGDLRRAERIAGTGLIGLGRIEWRDGSREVVVETAARAPRKAVRS